VDPNPAAARRSAVVRDVDGADVGLQKLVTDPGLLRQVLVNLLTNALDAVERSAGRVTVGAKSEGETVVITVSDNGHGIPAADVQRIFEPFYTTKGRGKGTGLGLAICRQLVAALGGSISVDSRQGQGSIFFVRLPRSGPPVSQAGGDGAASGARAAAGGRS